MPAWLDVVNAELPRAPFDLQEEVELYARESGRAGKLHIIPGEGWFARLTLRCNDKRMLAYQQGFAPEPPGEDVWFHIENPREHEGLTLGELKALEVPVFWPCIGMENGRCRQSFIPLDIVQMGREGIRRFLDAGNTWSGRGKHRSLVEALATARKVNDARKEKNRIDARENNRARMRDRRRSFFRIPFLRVGIDLKQKDDAGD